MDLKTPLSTREEVALRIYASMLNHYGLPDDDVANGKDCAKDALRMADDFLAVARGR